MDLLRINLPWTLFTSALTFLAHFMENQYLAA